MLEEQEDKSNCIIEDETVEELLSFAKRSNSLLSGRFNRNRSSLSTPFKAENTQRLISEEKCKDEVPRVEQLFMQKSELRHKPLASIVTPKMTRSVSTPEITRTKQFFNNRDDFNLLSFRLENKVDTDKVSHDLEVKPNNREFLSSLRKYSSNSNNVRSKLCKNVDINGKSNSLVSTHESTNCGSHILNSNWQSLHLNNAEDNGKDPSLRAVGHYNIDPTDKSIKSTRSIEEMLKECTINKTCKSNEYDLHSNPLEMSEKTKISSLDNRIPASPKQSLQFSNSDMLLVNGKSFLKLRQIGKGGSSVVYEALDLLTRHCRAIKFVDLKDEDESVKESYKNEVKILQKLQKYSRIVKVFDHEENDSQLKIVMEVGGNDLAAILSEARKRKISIPSYSVQHYFRDMLLAVQQIHSEGIIHSDLKPANFLLVDGILKLIDFGIASSIQHDMTSVFKDNQSGTFNYMSPESLSDIHSGPIINGKVEGKPTIKIGVKSDIWSLGCILYNLAYGYTPFQHLSNPLQKLAAISNPNNRIVFAPLSDKNLLNVLQSTLKFNPRDRPSIDELLKHPYLSDYLRGTESPQK